MLTLEEVVSIYNEKYAGCYEALYLSPWKKKHELNIQNLKRIMLDLPGHPKRWLDMCCGQAWHFSRFPAVIEKVGVDISEAQLKLARKRNPDARFIQGNILEIPFPKESFDLVTNFWAAYCYLNSYQLIKQLWKKAIEWTKTGGAIYFEALLPEDLKTFNASNYARRTGFQVEPRNPDFSEWLYRDTGGCHTMTSPPLDFFLTLLSPKFNRVEAWHDGGFMTHVIALGKH